MWIEGQSQPSYETQPINNELQNEQTDSLEQISEFFESNDLDTSIMKQSYDAFSQSQKDFIIKAYQKMQINPDLVMEIMELPYDDESFTFFQESLSLYIDIDDSKIIVNNNDKEISNNDKEISNNYEEISNNELSQLRYIELHNEYSKYFEDNWLYNDSDINTIKEFFLDWDKVNAFLIYVRDNHQDKFEYVYNKLNELNNLGVIQVSGLKPLEEYLSEKVDKKPLNYPNWITNPSGEWSMENGVYTIWNEKIDYNEKPPVKYLKSGKYELKSTDINDREIKQLRSEIFVLENTLDNNKTLLERNSQSLEQNRSFLENVNKATEFNQNSLNVLKQRTENESDTTLKSQILEAIDSYEESPDKSNLDSLKDILSKKPSIQIAETIALEAKVIEQEAKLDRMKLQLETKQEQFTKNVLERDEVAKSRLKILQNMTQWSVDQAPLEEIFTEMNNSSLQIDLWNGMIVSGFDLDTFEISGSGIPQWIHEDINNKKNDEIIARMMNVMFSWNPDKPIDLQTIYTWMPIFKDEAWKDISSTFSGNMRNELWLDPRKYMRDNIENHNSWSTKENNTEK